MININHLPNRTHSSIVIAEFEILLDSSQKVCFGYFNDWHIEQQTIIEFVYIVVVTIQIILHILSSHIHNGEFALQQMPHLSLH